MAASETFKEGVYLDNHLTELDERIGSNPLAINVDNQAARDLSYNPEFHQRTKHIDRRHFYVREMVEAGKITVPYVNTVDNLADFFTKPLPGRQFYAMAYARTHYEYPSLFSRVTLHRFTGGC